MAAKYEQWAVGLPLLQCCLIGQQGSPETAATSANLMQSTEQTATDCLLRLDTVVKNTAYDLSDLKGCLKSPHSLIQVLHPTAYHECTDIAVVGDAVS